jgi:acetate kinase
VIGDRRCIEPQIINERLLATLHELVDLAPDHLPQVIDGIAAVGRTHPNALQVACFDSAFHQRMPPTARMYALPRRFFQEGILRYGFHGLSCESIMQTLTALDTAAAQGRVIVAHLGNGSSITAIDRGTSIDTSMGFTPLAGLPMGTRCGDLDPGALLYLMKQEVTGYAKLNLLLNRESGLLGVSGYSPDMRNLLERESTDTRCAEAVSMFCYQAKKFIGAYTAALGRLDTLVFTGGIGENSAVIRNRISAGMDCIGITLDGAANASNAPVISPNGSPVTVRVIQTNEDLVIARHTWRVITNMNSRGDDDNENRV